jgi:hypothetical protein
MGKRGGLGPASQLRNQPAGSTRTIRIMHTAGRRMTHTHWVCVALVQPTSIILQLRAFTPNTLQVQHTRMPTKHLLLDVRYSGVS